MNLFSYHFLLVFCGFIILLWVFLVNGSTWLWYSMYLGTLWLHDYSQHYRLWCYSIIWNICIVTHFPHSHDLHYFVWYGWNIFSNSSCTISLRKLGNLQGLINCEFAWVQVDFICWNIPKISWTWAKSINGLRSCPSNLYNNLEFAIDIRMSYEFAIIYGD